MKKCPFCAEEIQDDAVKCRYCNEFLEDVKVKNQKGPWYFSTATLLISFLCVGPFMLPLVWFNPRYSRNTKIVITAVIFIISYFLTKMLIFSVGSLQEYFDLIQGNYPSNV